MKMGSIIYFFEFANIINSVTVRVVPAIMARCAQEVFTHV